MFIPPLFIFSAKEEGSETILIAVATGFSE